MTIVAYILNLPWTLLGILASIISIPINLSFKSRAIVINVKSFWWYAWIPGMRGVRGMAIGNVALLSPRVILNDL